MNNSHDTTEEKNMQEMIAQEFGFDDLSDDNQKQLVERMTESVIKRVLVEAYAKLSESDRQIFEEMVENIEDTDPNRIDAFLREKLTDYDGIIADAVSELKKHIADVTDTKK